MATPLRAEGDVHAVSSLSGSVMVGVPRPGDVPRATRGRPVECRMEATPEAPLVAICFVSGDGIAEVGALGVPNGLEPSCGISRR